MKIKIYLVCKAPNILECIIVMLKFTSMLKKERKGKSQQKGK